MDVLTNKAYKTHSKISRYTPFPYYYHTIDNKYVYGKTAYLKDTTIYTAHTVKQGDTFDSLALDYYNNPTLYWIICSFNRIQDPFQNLKVGSVIKIPAIANIEFDL